MEDEPYTFHITTGVAPNKNYTFISVPVDEHNYLIKCRTIVEGIAHGGADRKSAIADCRNTVAQYVSKKL